ncbi:MAG TPA: hypothetical protein VM910_39125 [Bradyrhizobium sp.]|jgi:hypothetical protein|nr:hypothetical protein [Bradyrhizobium sp.]
MATMTIFERLNQGRPPAEMAIKQSSKAPAQLLLDWLPRWPQDTITVRQIRVYGPYTIRNRRSAIDAAEVLVTNGWLKPIKPSRPDTYAWQITRKTILHPPVAM